MGEWENYTDGEILDVVFSKLGIKDSDDPTKDMMDKIDFLKDLKLMTIKRGKLMEKEE